MEIVEKKDSIVTNSLEDVLHNCMIPYAEYVIMDRALPRVEDGLKPVQRRILYSMYDQGMLPDKDFKKSARVVGDCLAKYHPHGDSSVYDAMVRLAQPFNMRAPLVQGHGNFGSVDGDSAAAMRYTEVRLQSLALELLRDIDKDTVDWDLNFDDTLQEPSTLPGRYPNLLVNGASGIAVGLATNIPPHNLCEVIDGACALIDHPKMKLDDLMKIIKGPDFPTGGYIVGGENLKKAYETGKGKIIIQSKINVEQEGDKKNIVITEMPYQTNKAALLKKISDLAEKNKEILGGIADVCDESDRKGMRAVIKLKKDVDPDKIIAFLNKTTGLQVSFGINMVAIAGGKPQQLGLIDILTYYIEYQRNIVLRRTKFDLDKAKERAHILEGLIIAVTNIDEVIQIIKKSPDTATARHNLRVRFNLSEKQAQAILDLRLARLTKLEVDNLKLELKELKEKIAYLQQIVESKKMQMSIVKEEMREIKKKHKEDRRSQIVGAIEEITVEKYDDVRPIENFVVGVCANGLIRKLKLPAYKKLFGEKSPNKKELFLISCPARSDQTILAFTNMGNCYKMDVELLPESKGSYAPGVKFEQLFKKAGSERPIAMFAVNEGEVPEGRLYFFTKMGYVKLSSWSEYKLLKGIFQAFKLKDGDELISVEQERNNTQLFFATEKGMCLYVEDSIPEQGRVAGGVKGIDLYSGDKVIYAAQVDDDFNGEILVATSFGTFKRVILGTINKLARARKGFKLVELGDNNSECVVFVKWLMGGEKVDLAVLDRLGIFVYTDSSKIVVENRTTKGKVISGIGACQTEKVFVIARQL
ncbi:MAG: DNA topoisomerase 4 subunit A [Clostridia bacterium]|nr:DNA topoisomerase 4 subunit A [Clostridia bacterium]